MTREGQKLRTSETSEIRSYLLLLKRSKNVSTHGIFADAKIIVGKMEVAIVRLKRYIERILTLLPHIPILPFMKVTYCIKRVPRFDREGWVLVARHEEILGWYAVRSDALRERDLRRLSPCVAVGPMSAVWKGAKV